MMLTLVVRVVAMMAVVMMTEGGGDFGGGSNGCCFNGGDMIDCGTWWLIGIFVAFSPMSRGFEFPYGRNLGTLGKSFTSSFLWRFGLNRRRSIRAMSVEHLSSSGLQKAR